MALGDREYRRLGIQAAAYRYGVPGAGATAGDEGVPWFSSYSRRKAIVEETDRRIAALWREVNTSTVSQAFRDQFLAFLQGWENFMGGLSAASILLPSTEEHANRVNLQLEQWRKRFEQEIGRAPDMPGYMPPAPGVLSGKPFPWGLLFTTVLVVAGVTALVYVGGKVPNLKTAPGAG